MIRNWTLAAVAGLGLLVPVGTGRLARAQVRPYPPARGPSAPPGVYPGPAAPQRPPQDFPPEDAPPPDQRDGQGDGRTPAPGPQPGVTPPESPPAPGTRLPLPPRVAQHFHVHYRACVHDRWRSVGTLDCEDEARELAAELYDRGYQVRIVIH